MIIKVRWTNGGEYAEVSVELGGGELETGLLNEAEQVELATKLREAAEELERDR